MVKLNIKGKPLLLMINGELFGIEEISGNSDPAEAKQMDTKFLTIKAINITGQRKLTVHLDLRLIDALREENRTLSYIH